jgi:transposase
MGVKGRRTYDGQFKADAVRLGTESNKTVREVAQSLGIEPGTLHTWIRQSGKRSGDAAPAQRQSETLEEEVRRLRRDLARVTDERDFLKKATAYFAKENK